MLYLLICFFSIITMASESLNKSDQAQIMKTMEQQENCWNKGDIDCFMEGYWESEQMRFIGKNGVTYGWQATLDRYKKSYPNKAAMGILGFDIISLEKLSKKKALMIGKWHLERNEQENLEGHFSLIWEKINKEWVIIVDHSS